MAQFTQDLSLSACQCALMLHLPGKLHRSISGIFVAAEGPGIEAFKVFVVSPVCASLSIGTRKARCTSMRPECASPPYPSSLPPKPTFGPLRRKLLLLYLVPLIFKLYASFDTSQSYCPESALHGVVVCSAQILQSDQIGDFTMLTLSPEPNPARI